MSESASTVTKCFTLKGGVLTQAILAGFKDMENRVQTWKPGWYAVHTGVGKAGPEVARGVETACGSDERWAAVNMLKDKCPEGAIAGLVFLAHALPVEDCAASPWASGPVCHVISKVLTLEQPIAGVKGQLGTWTMSPEVQAVVHEQVARCAITATGAETSFPRDDAAIERVRKAKRELKAKRLREAMEEGLPAKALKAAGAVVEAPLEPVPVER
jgi:hypothetical protein